MKHIKPYNIFENNQEPQHPGFPTTEEEIHRLCEKYKIKNYTINDDLSIDVDGYVKLLNRDLRYIPLKFNYISDYFNITYNRLELLKGAPHTVGGFFSCSDNVLETLEDAPNIVRGDFYCYNNNLKTLEGVPHTVGNGFDCSNNNLTSLKYLPSGIDYTNRITRFENNPIHSSVNTFIENYNAEQLVQEFNDYDIIRGDTVVLDRLKTFISDFDLEMPDIYEVKKYYKIV